MGEVAVIDEENGFENLDKGDWEKLLDCIVTILGLVKKIISNGATACINFIRKK